MLVVIFVSFSLYIIPKQIYIYIYNLYHFQLYILVRHNKEVKDIAIKSAGTKCCFNETDGTQCDTVLELIKHYHKKALPVLSDIILKSGVPRHVSKDSRHRIITHFHFRTGNSCIEK